MDMGLSIEATELDCRWECREDCEAFAVPGGLWEEGTRCISVLALAWALALALALSLSLCRRRPKNLPADDCLPLPSCDELGGIVLCV